MQPEHAQQNHLFTLRLWGEEAETGELEWRGQLYHVQSSTTRYFQEWAALIPLLLRMLRETGAMEIDQAAGRAGNEDCGDPPD